MRKLLFMGSILILLSSCGGSPKKDNPVKVLKPRQTQIKGDLSGYFNVVDKEYKIDESSMFKTIQVELERVGDDLPFDVNRSNPFGVDGVGEHKEDYHVGFGIEILDEAGNVIFVKQPTGDGFSGPYSTDDIENIIRIDLNETGTVQWSIDDNAITKGKTFRISSALKDERSFSNKKTAGTSSNWDTTLDEFEKAINKIYKDPTNMDNMNTAENLQSRLINNKDELTDKQVSRLNQLIKRID